MAWGSTCLNLGQNQTGEAYDGSSSGFAGLANTQSKGTAELTVSHDLSPGEFTPLNLFVDKGRTRPPNWPRCRRSRRAA